MLSSFGTAFFGLALTAAPLWFIARTGDSFSLDLFRLGTATILAVAALVLLSAGIPPFYARTVVIALLVGGSAWAIHRRGISRQDGYVMTGLLSAAALSAIFPDTSYVNWDNYTHWSVIIKSYDFGEPMIGNQYTKFPTYPPFHPLLVYLVQGLSPFTTQNLQTYKILLLLYLTALMLRGSDRAEPRRMWTVVCGLALWLLLIALSYRIGGPLQSAYADFTASTMLSIVFVAAYLHIRNPSRAALALAVTATAVLPLVRIGLELPSILIAALIVCLDRLAVRGAIRPKILLYISVVAAPIMAGQLHNALFFSYYGGQQSAPSDLIGSLGALLSEHDPVFLQAIASALFVDGVPSFRGVGVSIGLMIAAGVAAGAASLYTTCRSQACMLYLAGSTGIMLLWVVGVTLQMKGFFAGDPALPSYERYVGIMLYPFLVAMLVPLLQVGGREGRRLAIVLCIGGATLLHAALAPTAFWHPERPQLRVLPIAEEIRPMIGRNKIWVVTAPDVEDPHFSNFAFHYFLMPAITNGNGCFSAGDCPERSSADFSRHLFAAGYDWVLVNAIGTREKTLLEPLVTEPAFLQQRAGQHGLFRVTPDPVQPGEVALVPVPRPRHAMAVDDVPRFGSVR